MEISGFAISLLSLLVGIAATVLVSRYYFNRSTDKSLTPYLDFGSQLLSGIDPEVKKDLSIKYQDVEVADLLQIQYLVANTGEKPIRDIIRPLSLTIPDEGIILDASILHIHPEGRDVELYIDENKRRVHFLFPILNKGDFFIVKLLIKGSPKENDIEFTISVDDLPPKLVIERLPRQRIATKEAKEEKQFEKGVFIAGAICIFLGASPIYLAYQIDTVWFAFDIDSIIAFFRQLTWLHLAKVASWITGLFMGFIGIGMTILSLESVEFRKKHKYLIPDGLTRPRSSIYSLRMERLEAMQEELAEIEGGKKNDEAYKQRER